MFHFCLKLYKIRSEFADTLAIYTVVAGLLSPVMAVLLYPSNIELLLLIQREKHANSPLAEAVYNVWSGLMKPGPGLEYVNYIAAFTTPLALFLSSLVLALLINLTYMHYNASKYSVVSALALAMLVSVIPIFGLTSIDYLLLWETVA